MDYQSAHSRPLALLQRPARMAFIWLTLGAVFLTLNGDSLYSRARATPAGMVEPAKTASLASLRLPAGGGGKSHYFQECSAALASGVGRDPAKPMRLPEKLRPLADNPIKAVMDYTRLAVLTALSEAFAEVAAFGEVRTPLRKQLKTGDEVEYTLIPWDAVVDRCDYAESPHHCDMHTWTAQQEGSPLRNAPYDIIFFSQTFEHLFDLPLALARNRALVAPGGFVWVSVPGWNIYHMAPSHQQNLSPCGLFAQLTAAGFDVVRLGWFHNANYSEYLTTPGNDWPPWPRVPDAPDPFVDIPLGATAVGRANTVWALARAPLQAPPPPPPLTVDFATRPVISWADMNSAQSLRNMIPYRATFVWPSVWAMSTVLGVYPAWIDDDVAHVVFAASFLESLVPLVGADGTVFASGRTARAVVDALVPRGTRVHAWEPPAPGEVQQRGGSGGGHGKTSDAKVAVITDLFEATVDPLGALQGAISQLSPGTSVLIACRSADLVNAYSSGLSTCTEYGFTQLLFRAKLINHVQSYSMWGRAGYTRASLAHGKILSVRDILRTPLERSIHAGDCTVTAVIGALETATDFRHVMCESECACTATAKLAEGPSAERAHAAIGRALHEIVRDSGDYAANSWPAIMYAVVVL